MTVSHSYLELFSWMTTSHQDHLEVCLSNSRLLSGLIGMWSSMNITPLYDLVYQSVWTVCCKWYFKGPFNYYVAVWYKHLLTFDNSINATTTRKALDFDHDGTKDVRFEFFKVSVRSVFTLLAFLLVKTEKSITPTWRQIYSRAQTRQN